VIASLAAARPLPSAPAGAFEEIGLDLAVIALLAAGATWLLRRHGPAPLFLYFATANVAGLVLTAALKLA
jgi:hypothetical protein